MCRQHSQTTYTARIAGRDRGPYRVTPSLLTCQSDMGLDPPHERHSTACSNGAMSRTSPESQHQRICLLMWFANARSLHVLRSYGLVRAELMRLWETHTSPVTCVLRAAMHRCSSKLPQNDLYFEFKAFLSSRCYPLTCSLAQRFWSSSRASEQLVTAALCWDGFSVSIPIGGGGGASHNQKSNYLLILS